jgi:hypothetical protein
MNRSNGLDPSHDDNVALKPNKLIYKNRDAVKSALRPTVFDRDCLAPYPAQVTEALPERLKCTGSGSGICVSEIADLRLWHSLLRLGCERRRHGPQREPAEERAPVHQTNARASPITRMVTS